MSEQREQALKDFNVLEEATNNLERLTEAIDLTLAAYFKDGEKYAYGMATEEKFSRASNAVVYLIDGLRDAVNEFYHAEDVLAPYFMKREQEAP